MSPQGQEILDKELIERFEIESEQKLAKREEVSLSAAGLWQFTVMEDSMPQASNSIRTSKYTTWSFAPMNLLHQLSKPANIYFIIICVLQMIKPISITGGSPTNLPPLIFVMAVSAVKDFFEDRVRQKSDAEENDRPTQVLQNDGSWQVVKWKDVKVGQVVKVMENEFLPVDIIITRTSSDNVCYIETKNLDGETNLKHKSAPKETVELPELHFKNAQIKCEQPSDKIYQFQGVMQINNLLEKVVLNYENFALRGCSLRNTDYIIGVVTYVGADTRIMRNSVRSRAKFSDLERKTGVQIVFIFLTMMACCATAATYVVVWNRVYDVSTNSYLDFYPVGTPPPEWNGKRSFVVWIKAFGTWILLFTNMVPISLLVTLEIVKFTQASFIGWDCEIYSIEKDMPTKVQSNNLNEELGQIEYIFSDKTGTLTCNVMDFRKLSAGNFSYGSSDRIENFRLQELQFNQQEPLVSNVNFDSQELMSDLIPGSRNYQKSEAIVLNLALNHSVLIGSRGYCASSPDELALVNSAKFVGYTFISRDNRDNTVIIDVKGKQLTYKLLQVIDFTSSRKRMTSIFRDPQGEIVVYTKGADSVLFPLCAPGQEQIQKKTQEFMDLYANEGLRTLLLAQKRMSEKEYQQWANAHKQATLSVSNRDELLEQVASQIENNFEIIGSTAIEDRLQEGVPESIRHIRQAGIKLWVLTGDKIETAINIGYSSGLIDQSLQQYIIDAKSSVDVYKQICVSENNLNLILGQKKIAIIVAGDSLIKIMGKQSIKEKFVSLIDKSSVVLACRVSPIQKAEIVQMIREVHPEAKTLAIGDGANDVNMITAAHVGIGISGLEGQQAARSSDYAIGQFSFLIPLLFVHGREAYRRNSYLVIYMFYKNVLFVLPQFWFGFVNSFSGQTLYESWLYQAYNIVFTSFPIMWFAVYDFQHTRERLLSDASVYYIGLKGICFSTKVFFQNIFNAVFNGLFLMLFCFKCEDGTVVNNQGKNGSFWVDGTMVYAAVVLVVNLKIAQKTNTHTWVSTTLIGLSILMFWLQLALESAIPYFSQVYEMFPQLISSGRTYSVLFLCCWFNVGQFIMYYNLWRWKVEEKYLAELEEKFGQDTDVVETEGGEVKNYEEKYGQEVQNNKYLGVNNPVLKEREGSFGYAFNQENNLSANLITNREIVADAKSKKPQSSNRSSLNQLRATETHKSQSINSEEDETYEI